MISRKHIYFLFLPAILVVGILLFVRIIQYAPLFPDESVYSEKIPTNFSIPIYPDDPILGNKKAGITLVAFEDFGCHGCSLQNQVFDQLLAQYPNKIKIIWKSLPVTNFPNPSDEAHAYGYCANKQKKFSAFKQLAFNNNENLSKEILSQIATEIDLNEKKLESCLESGDAENYIEKNTQLATILQIQAVPTVFWDNKQIQSPATVSGWAQLLNLE